MARVALIVFIVTLAIAPVWAGKDAAATASLVSAKAAILMDRQTGMVLWEKNADQRLPMASTTKIMTAIVILDQGGDRLNEQVTISKHAFATGGSSTLAEGDTLTLRDVLKAAMINSSNEATVAAAEFLAGSESAFVDMMNQKASELKLTGTHFVNPHGLYDPARGKEHYTTARDLASMTRYALTHYPLLRDIITIKTENIQVTPRGRVNLLNRNRIINQPIPGIPTAKIDGVKTGYVNEAGKCLVVSATNNNWQLIAVVLNSPSHFAECQTLLQYGFTHYAWKTYASEQQAGVSVPVIRGALPRVPLGVRGVLGVPVPTQGGVPADELVFRQQRVRAPIEQNALVGELQVRRNGHVIATAPAIAMAAVPVAWWVRVGVALFWSLVTLVALSVLGKIYGTCAKNARRRRRLVAQTGGNTDFGRPRDGEW